LGRQQDQIWSKAWSSPGLEAEQRQLEPLL
jgi:hypothetical protein